MLKKLLVVVLTVIVALSVFSACEKEKATFTVTFKQQGQTDIVKTVEEGDALTDIPVPVEVIGHDVAWSSADFSSITENIVVNAIATPKTYTITYTCLDNSEYTVTLPAVKSVKYGEAFVLDVPTVTTKQGAKERYFKGWKLDGNDFIDGTWTFTENITLVAYFGIVEGADGEWL